jgi:HEAT repeat protein
MSNPLTPTAVLLLLGLCAGCSTHGARTSSSTAGLATSTDLRARVYALLSSEHATTDDEWKQLGPEALAILQEVYGDVSADPLRRTRAVGAMGQVDNPAAADFLKDLTTNEQVDIAYRSAALLAYEHRTGSAALPEIKLLLPDPNARLRATAVLALTKVGTSEARALLEEQLTREEDPSIRDAIEKGLTKIEP